MSSIHLEIELNYEYHEGDNDNLTLTGLFVPGSKFNLMPLLSPADLERAQDFMVESESDRTLAKAEALRERVQMRGDYLRELALEARMEHCSSSNAQRGAKPA